MTLILSTERRWYCPRCPTEAVTHRADAHTEFHHCAGLAGLWAPMVPAGTRADLRTVERQDYIGTDQVQTDDDGRPIMATVITRDDGEDVVMYAPCAQGSVRDA